MVTLRSFEFIIPFGTQIELNIVDEHHNTYRYFSFIWPKSGGGYLSYEVLDVIPCFDKNKGSYLYFKIKKTIKLVDIQAYLVYNNIERWY